MSSIEEQWAHDVTDYGDNAYQMWEYSTGLASTVFKNAGNNRQIAVFFERSIAGNIRRKESAALPFDESAAKKGDVVEAFIYDKWVECADIKECVGTDIFKVQTIPSYIEHHVKINDLRMKHPRIVGKEY